MKCKTCESNLTPVEIENDFCFECDDHTDFDLDIEVEKEFFELKKR